jgi:hypothetical protein
MNCEKMDKKLTAELDKFLATLARLFAQKGASAEVTVLTHGRRTCEKTGYGNYWDGGKNYYTITLIVPQSLYNQVADRRETVEKSLNDESAQLMRRYPAIGLDEFIIMPMMPDDPEWRNKARRWLSGETVSNQGRVRSDNVAPYQEDGLLFRSEPEKFLYHALMGLKISFAPLAVFMRGGELRHRVEPDFFIFHEGQVLVLELDGKQFHHETAAEADARLALLKREGAYIEHIESAECDTAEKAKTVAKQIIALLEKLKANK